MERLKKANVIINRVMFVLALLPLAVKVIETILRIAQIVTKRQEQK